ncbi:hypothetical protein NPIL_597891 [Nephila pilipes]|uniref:Uncharacterized protein n=1 Tax=Nephila pilipes TaxID=299642 RepID=A0A8X6TVJ8_NEPPI|nr:hypothetical protein NPIL_597891 [Nephila pilipes]
MCGWSISSLATSPFKAVTESADRLESALALENYGGYLLILYEAELDSELIVREEPKSKVSFSRCYGADFGPHDMVIISRVLSLLWYFVPRCCAGSQVAVQSENAIGSSSMFHLDLQHWTIYSSLRLRRLEFGEVFVSVIERSSLM